MKKSIFAVTLLALLAFVCVNIGAQESAVYHLVVIDRANCPGAAVEVVMPLFVTSHGRTGYYIVFGRGEVTMPSGAEVLVDMNSDRLSIITEYLASRTFRQYVSNPQILEGIRFAVESAQRDRLGTRRNPYDWTSEAAQLANADIPAGSYIRTASGSVRQARAEEIAWAKREAARPAAPAQQAAAKPVAQPAAQPAARTPTTAQAAVQPAAQTPAQTAAQAAAEPAVQAAAQAAAQVAQAVEQAAAQAAAQAVAQALVQARALPAAPPPAQPAQPAQPAAPAAPAARQTPEAVPEPAPAPAAPVSAPEVASEERDFTTDNNGTIVSYEGWADKIVIPAQIGGKTVQAIGSEAFKGFGLTSVTIPGSVTQIGVNAFARCAGLASVTLSRRTQVEDGAFPEGARITYND
jgi:hypothetical protein